MSEALSKYIEFLLVEMQKDAQVLDCPWVYGTVVPFALYAAYMLVKWYLLLAPVTVPLAVIVMRQSKVKLPWLQGNSKN
jgi:hypothetical protein